jgi:hypothetical protein
MSFGGSGGIEISQVTYFWAKASQITRSSGSLIIPLSDIPSVRSIYP